MYRWQLAISTALQAILKTSKTYSQAFLHLAIFLAAKAVKRNGLPIYLGIYWFISPLLFTKCCMVPGIFITMRSLLDHFRSLQSIVGTSECGFLWTFWYRLVNRNVAPFTWVTFKVPRSVTHYLYSFEILNECSCSIN